MGWSFASGSRTRGPPSPPGLRRVAFPSPPPRARVKAGAGNHFGLDWIGIGGIVHGRRPSPRPARSRGPLRTGFLPSSTRMDAAGDGDGDGDGGDPHAQTQTQTQATATNNPTQLQTQPLLRLLQSSPLLSCSGIHPAMPLSLSFETEQRGMIVPGNQSSISFRYLLRARPLLVPVLPSFLVESYYS